MQEVVKFTYLRRKVEPGSDLVNISEFHSIYAPDSSSCGLLLQNLVDDDPIEGAVR